MVARKLALSRATGSDARLSGLDRLWSHLDRFHIDHYKRIWLAEVVPEGRPVEALFSGKPYIYHALTAALAVNGLSSWPRLTAICLAVTKMSQLCDRGLALRQCRRCYMALNLNDLRLFVEIVEHEGILRAGRALGLPKSTISRRLSALEEQLRRRLVVRSADGLTLTAAGRETYALARRMVDAARQTEERLLMPDGPVAGQVVVSVAPMLAPWIAPAANELMRAHPGLLLYLDLSDRLVQPMGDGPDLYLRAQFEPLSDSSLIQRRICCSPTALAAAPRAQINTVEDVARAGLLAFSADPGRTEWRLTDPAGDMRILRLGARAASTDPAFLIAMAEQGRGVALVAEASLRASFSAGRLVPVLAGWQGGVITVSLLSPPRHAMSPALRHSADTIAAAVKAGVLGVPLAEGGVPQSRPPVVANPLHGAVTPRQPARSLEIAQQQGEDAMTPMQTKLSAAALGTAMSIAAGAQAEDAAGPLVLYTNDFEGVITERFEADTGRQIDVVQMSGGELLARIAAEAANPQWDALIFNGSYTFQMLDDQGALKRGVEPDNIGNLNEIGTGFLPENRSWFPIGLVASCVMLYRTDLVENPPADFGDLVDPRFEGQFGMADPAVAAPAYPCVASFFERMGDEDAKTMFAAFFDNGMRVFRTNGPVGRALESGEISLALITSQVAYTLLADGATPVNVVWPEEGAPGSVRGVGISDHTSRPEAAKALVEWLLEPETQSYLAESVEADGKFEPTVTGALRRADGPPEGARYLVADDAFAVANEAEIKTWFADQALR